MQNLTQNNQNDIFYNNNINNNKKHILNEKNLKNYFYTKIKFLNDVFYYQLSF